MVWLCLHIVLHSQLRFLPCVGGVHSTVFVCIVTATVCMRDGNGLVIYRTFHVVHWGRGKGGRGVFGSSRLAM